MRNYNATYPHRNVHADLRVPRSTADKARDLATDRCAGSLHAKSRMAINERHAARLEAGLGTGREENRRLKVGRGIQRG